MRITIDTKSKTVHIHEEVKINDVIELLNKLLPNDEWKEYKFELKYECNYQHPTIIIKTTPYIQEITPFPINPINPIWYENPYKVTCSAETSDNFNIK